jgi:hypothetical protein
VLNVSGNSDITELPPQMGLLSRLWNLNTQGCKLQEPLKSMIESKKYKTMDVIGYLKSVLEDAKPYARMKLMIVGIQGIGKTLARLAIYFVQVIFTILSDVESQKHYKKKTIKNTSLR